MEGVDRLIDSLQASRGTSGDPPPAVTCNTCGELREPKLVAEIRGRKIWTLTDCRCMREAAEEERRRYEIAAQARRLQELYDASGLMAMPRLMRCKWETYEPKTDAQYHALATVREYAEAFDQRTEDGLVLVGAPGSGKTHLAAALCHHLIQAGYQVRFRPVPQLLQQIRATFGREETRETEASILRDLTRARLLVLDDLGTEKVTDWVAETLFVIIDDRYQRLLPTVVTTNCSMAELGAKVGEKTMSRILGMTRGVRVAGPDHRARHLAGR